MYADEILFEAGLRYDRMSDSLTTNEVRRLWQSIVQTIYDAVKYRDQQSTESLPRYHWRTVDHSKTIIRSMRSMEN